MTLSDATLLCAQVEVYLEEMLLLCQRSEEYNGFMLARLQSPAGTAGESQLPSMSPRVRLLSLAHVHAGASHAETLLQDVLVNPSTAMDVNILG